MIIVGSWTLIAQTILSVFLYFWMIIIYLFILWSWPFLTYLWYSRLLQYCVLCLFIINLICISFINCSRLCLFVTRQICKSLKQRLRTFLLRLSMYNPTNSALLLRLVFMFSVLTKHLSFFSIHSQWLAIVEIVFLSIIVICIYLWVLMVVIEML